MDQLGSFKYFAVYIIHIHQPVFNWLKETDNYLLGKYSYPEYFALMGGVVLLVFAGSILYDKVMKVFTVPIVCLIEDKINKVRFFENII